MSASDWQDKRFSNEDILTHGFPDLRGGINENVASQLQEFYEKKAAAQFDSAIENEVLDQHRHEISVGIKQHRMSEARADTWLERMIKTWHTR